MYRFRRIPVLVALSLTPLFWVSTATAQTRSVASTDDAGFAGIGPVAMASNGLVLVGGEEVPFQSQGPSYHVVDTSSGGSGRALYAESGELVDGAPLEFFGVVLNSAGLLVASSQTAIWTFDGTTRQQIATAALDFRFNDRSQVLMPGPTDGLVIHTLPGNTSETVTTSASATIGALTDDGSVLWKDDNGIHKNDELLVWDFFGCPLPRIDCTYYSATNLAYSSSGRIVFGGSATTIDKGVSQGTDRGIFVYLESAGGVVDVLRRGDALPDSSFSNPYPLEDPFISNSGEVTFRVDDQDSSYAGIWTWADGAFDLRLRTGTPVPAPGFEAHTTDVIDDFSVARNGRVAATVRTRNPDGFLRTGLLLTDENGDFRMVASQFDSLKVDVRPPGSSEPVWEVFTVEGWRLGDLNQSRGQDGLPAVFTPNGDLVAIANLRRTSVPKTVSGRALVITGFEEEQFAIRMLDASGSPVPNTSFEIARVAYDEARYAQTPLGTYTTDGDGVVDLTATPVVPGDSIRVSQKVRRYLSPRRFRRDVLPWTAFNLTVDNAHIDPNTYQVTFDRPRVALVPTDISVNHPEVRVNLSVAIEWDADDDYVDRLKAGIRSASNFLYDVTDGQARLDTVLIVDNELPVAADIHVQANNSSWPRANRLGIYQERGWHLWLPPVWFGNTAPETLDRLRIRPMQPDSEFHFRTLAHELGHFAFNFLDEYVFVVWDRAKQALVQSTNRAHRCMDVQNYGFMQSQYPSGGPRSSEMSDDGTYSILACRNTNQWVTNRGSTWSQFERVHNSEAGSNLFDIVTPTDRGLGRLFEGPNDDLTKPDYDVGAAVVFLGANSAPTHAGGLISILDRGQFPTSGVGVYQIMTASGRIVYHGVTGASGQMRMFDASEAYRVFADGWPFEDESRIAQKTGQLEAPTYRWVSGSADADSDSLSMTPVDGTFPFTPEILFDGSSLNYTLRGLAGLAAPPSVSWSAPDGTGASAADLSLVSETDYTVAIPMTDSTALFLRATVADSAGSDFFFSSFASGVHLEPQDGTTEITSPDGLLEVNLDSLRSGHRSMVLLGSDYPPLRGGLSPDQLQVSNVYAIALLGQLPGEQSSVSIHYNESRTQIPVIEADENTIHVFRWDAGDGEWQMLSSAVDSVDNVVSAVFEEAGTYAAFSTNVDAALNDGRSASGALPAQVLLRAPYPNPARTTATIEYDIPESMDVRLSVFDLLGRRVRVIVAGPNSVGRHSATFNARSLSSGVYFIVLEAGGERQIERVVLTR